MKTKSAVKKKVAAATSGAKKAAKKAGSQAAQKIGAKKPSLARRGLKFAAAAGAVTALAMGVNKMRKSMAAANLDTQDSDTGAQDDTSSAFESSSDKRSTSRAGDRSASTAAQR